MIVSINQCLRLAGAALLLLCSALHSGDALAKTSEQSRCAELANKSRLNLERDLLVVNYDIKPDVDDIHAGAAFATFANKFPGCFDYVVVAGTYGTQGGEFIESTPLFDLAFSNNWFDAHRNRSGTIEKLAARMERTLRAGGAIWIAEGGQSDVSADAIALLAAKPKLAARLRERIHLVQHADWNEKTTTAAKLAYVRSTVDYVRIADGNTAGNGTPDFAIDDPSWWPKLLDDPRNGPIWAEAKRLADKANPGAAYVNPAVANLGLDFSDTVEVAYIFGFETLADHNAFFVWLLHPGVLRLPHDTHPPDITRWMARPAVLVFSKTVDWRHNEGIAGADRFFAELTTERGWGYYTTANSEVFRPEILDRFALVIFNNVTGDTLSAKQRAAFEAWFERGGAWIGLHGSGDDSHGAWPWYARELVGPTFVGHPADPQLQEARLVALASDHPLLKGLPPEWRTTDEWYSFDAPAARFGMTPILGMDESSYKPVNPQYGPREDLRMGPSPADHAIVWTRCHGRGRSVYSALGHSHRAYDSPTYGKLLRNAVDWVLSRDTPDGCPATAP